MAEGLLMDPHVAQAHRSVVVHSRECLLFSFRVEVTPNLYVSVILTANLTLSCEGNTVPAQ